jgi:Tol biopolymer transport system component
MIRAAALLLAAWCTGQAAVASPLRWTPPELSTELYESSPGFSPDGRELVFMRADRAFGRYRLLWSRCEGGRWTVPQPPPFAAPPPALEADPSFSPDGRALYFVSSRQSPDQGDDLDIWKVERDAAGQWGAPRRLPEPVNSPAAELLPRVDTRGRLWFGSSRPGGHGQGDIYIATPDGHGGYTVANAGPPLSTPANEYEAEPASDGRSVVVVADRGDRSHLYRFTRDAAGGWVEHGRIAARDDVFQVGPLLSPRGERLLFAQADADALRSGEWFVVDLVPGTREDWPPRCH